MRIQRFNHKHGHWITDLSPAHPSHYWITDQGDLIIECAGYDEKYRQTRYRVTLSLSERAKIPTLEKEPSGR